MSLFSLQSNQDSNIFSTVNIFIAAFFVVVKISSVLVLQTGSGKTYSIMGYGQDKGVIPQMCDALFYFVGRYGADKFKIDASYLEVYNEQITDLLCPPPVEEDYVPLTPKERIKVETKLKKLVREKDSMGKNNQEIAKLKAQLDPAEAKKQQTSVMPKVVMFFQVRAIVRSSNRFFFFRSEKTQKRVWSWTTSNISVPMFPFLKYCEIHCQFRAIFLIKAAS